jgi:lipopolysaccharide/colanic/teichoic acid biosynthesis glycosyltransferase
MQFMNAHASHPRAFFAKRVLDLCASLLGLLLLWPLLLVIAFLVRLLLGSPVFFVQRRPGLHGLPFSLWKFRTMRDAMGADGQLLSDAERLTRFGRFLRASSLDELPELWNVLTGDMSLVGPRPWLMEYLPHYTAEQMRRHEVRPGITGWAQINGRNAATWEERLRLDVWYVDHWSFWLDLRILLRTVWTVVRREGISAEGHATMPRFDQQNTNATYGTLVQPTKKEDASPDQAHPDVLKPRRKPTV